MKKPRSDSKLDRLAPERREALGRWLLEENLSYQEAQERLQKDWGVRSSPAAIGGFYQRVQQERLLARIGEARDLADGIRGELESSSRRTGAATIQLVSQKAFELAVAQSGDVKSLATLVQLLLKARQQELDERKVKLLEQKAAQADATRDVVESKLTPEQQQARIREIFGLATT